MKEWGEGRAGALLYPHLSMTQDLWPETLEANAVWCTAPWISQLPGGAGKGLLQGVGMLALCYWGWNTKRALSWALKPQYLISLLFPKHKNWKSFLRGWGTGKNRFECPSGKWEQTLSLPHLVCLDLGAMAQRGEEGAFLWFFGFFLLLRGRQIKCAHALWTKTRKEINLTLKSIWTDLVTAVFGKMHEANG